MKRKQTEALIAIVRQAAQYLEHPDIAAIGDRFALPSSNIVRGLRAAVTDLQRDLNKPRKGNRS